MVGLSSYESGTKQTWRGWQWNRIAERIPKVKRRDAVVAYLVGPDDEDRKCALRAGFQNHNIIAVDIDADNVQRVRQAGGVAIQGHLSDVVAMWPKDIPLSAVVADLTCGFSESADVLSFALFMSCAVAESTIISVNLMRGRDVWSNRQRAEMKAVSDGMHKSEYTAPWEWPQFKGFFGDRKLADHIKHRGLQWQLRLVRNFVDTLADFNEFNDPEARCASWECVHLMKEMNAVCASYKSHVGAATLVFDSVVFKWPVTYGNRPRRWPIDTPTMQGFIAYRQSMTEAGAKVKFDYQSYVAKFACLKSAREKLAAA